MGPGNLGNQRLPFRVGGQLGNRWLPNCGRFGECSRIHAGELYHQLDVSLGEILDLRQMVLQFAGQSWNDACSPTLLPLTLIDQPADIPIELNQFCVDRRVARVCACWMRVLSSFKRPSKSTRRAMGFLLIVSSSHDGEFHASTTLNAGDAIVTPQCGKSASWRIGNPLPPCGSGEVSGDSIRCEWALEWRAGSRSGCAAARFSQPIRWGGIRGD